jgi:hypothetical protein
MKIAQKPRSTRILGRLPAGCARAAIGHAAAAPASPAMKSRRLMGLPPNRAGVACHKGCDLSWPATSGRNVRRGASPGFALAASANCGMIQSSRVCDGKIRQEMMLQASPSIEPQGSGAGSSGSAPSAKPIEIRPTRSDGRRGHHSIVAQTRCVCQYIRGLDDR